MLFLCKGNVRHTLCQHRRGKNLKRNSNFVRVCMCFPLPEVLQNEGLDGPLLLKILYDSAY